MQDILTQLQLYENLLSTYKWLSTFSFLISIHFVFLVDLHILHFWVSCVGFKSFFLNISHKATFPELLQRLLLIPQLMRPQQCLFLVSQSILIFTYSIIQIILRKCCLWREKVDFSPSSDRNRKGWKAKTTEKREKKAWKSWKKACAVSVWPPLRGKLL